MRRLWTLKAFGYVLIIRKQTALDYEPKLPPEFAEYLRDQFVASGFRLDGPR